MVLNENGGFDYIRGAVNITFGGIDVDDLPGYDPMSYQPWREFRSSHPSIITCENLLVTRPEYDTLVTIDSVFTYTKYAKYWEKFGENSDLCRFEAFFKQPVSVTVKVLGTSGSGTVEDITATRSHQRPGTLRDSQILQNSHLLRPAMRTAPFGMQFRLHLRQTAALLTATAICFAP